MPLTRLAVRPVAANPAGLSGLVGLFEADSGVYQDAGVTPVSANNDPVGRWADLSGNGHHLDQATALSKPLYKTNALSGKPVITGDGVDDYLKAASFTLVQPFTVMAVQRLNVASASRRFWDGNAIDSAEAYQQPNAGDYSIFAGARVDAFPAQMSGGVWFVMSAVVNGASSRFRKNREAEVTGNPSTGNPNGFTLMARGDAGVPSAMSYAALAIVNRALTSAEEDSVLEFWANKWGAI